jgi:hypothetical protein
MNSAILEKGLVGGGGANSATAGVASDGKNANTVASQQVSCILAGGKNAKTQILVNSKN